MKKSEIYHEAMRAVLSTGFSHDTTIEILEVLMEDKKSAQFWEKREAQKTMENEEVSADEAV